MSAVAADTTINYRPMTRKDLAAAHALTQEMRWQHRLEDWDFVYRLGLGFVAERDGVVLGTGLCWKHGERHASLGMIIVSPQQQGQGIGRELMTRILRELGDRCTLLNATAAGQPLYERLGFVPTGTVHQHQGNLLAVAPQTLAEGERIRTAVPGDMAKLRELASRAAGMERGAVLTQLLDVAECVVLERGGEAIGFSAVRRFGRGHAIGPVVAPDGERAKGLIAHWAQTHAGAFVRVDVTGASDLGAWLPELGLAEAGTCVTMARNGVPPLDAAIRQFAVVNQALF
jgi:predicted N-acetyltransferase YhbS